MYRLCALYRGLARLIAYIFSLKRITIRVLAIRFQSRLGVKLLTKILSVDCDDLKKELTGCFWSAVADLLSCRIQDDREENMSGQAMVG